MKLLASLNPTMKFVVKTILWSLVFVLIYISFPYIFGKKEAPAPDTDLVKCIEKKVLSGEIHMDTMSIFWRYNDEWIDDSTIVIEVTREDMEFNSESGEFEFLNYATLEIDGKNIELSKNESDRIVEITEKQKKKLENIVEAKQKIAKAKQKKEQNILKAKFLKNCK